MASDCSSKYGVADDAWNESSAVACGSGFLTVVKKVETECGVVEMRCVFLEMPYALILEVFRHLDARELCIVSCVCSLFKRLASDSHGWKDFYCERWGLPAVLQAGRSEGVVQAAKSWRDLYVDREWRSKALTGRFRMDMLHGHTAPVRCVRLLPAGNVVVTVGYDSVVRIWNMEEGLPCASSRPLGETLRAIAVDMSMLAVAGSDAVIRVWHGVQDCPHLFDVGGEAEMIVRGHKGPITCLAMDAANMYSGSWDMCIKIWQRSSFKCLHSLRHRDWVWSLAARGRRVFSSAGKDAYTWDVESGEQVRVRVGVHTGQVYAVEATQSGHFVFTGGEDGAVRMFDDRVSWRRSSRTGLASSQGTIAAWIPHAGAVYSLAYEDPWLVSASGDGLLAMMNVRQVMKRATVQRPWLGLERRGESTQRMLPGFNQSAYSVDIGADRVVSGGEEGVVRVWDFSQALEMEQRVQASRSIRLEQRCRRKKGVGKGRWAGASSILSADELHSLHKNWAAVGNSCKGSVLQIGCCLGKPQSSGCLHQA